MTPEQLEKKRETARKNGAKSRGPVTAAGKFAAGRPVETNYGGASSRAARPRRTRPCCARRCRRGS